LEPSAPARLQPGADILMTRSRKEKFFTPLCDKHSTTKKDLLDRWIRVLFSGGDIGTVGTGSDSAPPPCRQHPEVSKHIPILRFQYSINTTDNRILTEHRLAYGGEFLITRAQRVRTASCLRHKAQITKSYTLLHHEHQVQCYSNLDRWG